MQVASFSNGNPVQGKKKRPGGWAGPVDGDAAYSAGMASSEMSPFM
jgi:hypothetical protein